jgi:prepilin-type N-terminal cleavage/methylation domain-containing protein
MGGWQRVVRATFYFTAGYVLIPMSVPEAFQMGKRRGEQLMNRVRPRSARAFTLIEMIVVVSIVAILLSLVGVGAVSWINSSKVRATAATLEALKVAIDDYVNERPMASGRGDPRSTTGPNPNQVWTLPDGHLGYDAFFGALPPSPTARIDLVTPTVDPFIEDLPAHVPTISRQFSHMVIAYLQGSNAQNDGREGLSPSGTVVWKSPAVTPPSEDYASIECLVLFLSQMSPSSRSKIDKLKDCTSNLDRDRAILAGTGARADLVEITDAWDKPLRWSVRRVTDTLVRWELRSAGKDGKFSLAFTPKEKSDDVILQGP